MWTYGNILDANQARDHAEVIKVEGPTLEKGPVYLSPGSAWRCSGRIRPIRIDLTLMKGTTFVKETDSTHGICCTYSRAVPSNSQKISATAAATKMLFIAPIRSIKRRKGIKFNHENFTEVAYLFQIFGADPRSTHRPDFCYYWHACRQIHGNTVLQKLHELGFVNNYVMENAENLQAQHNQQFEIDPDREGAVEI